MWTHCKSIILFFDVAPKDTIKKLCCDGNPKNDKRNAALIKMLATKDEEIKNMITDKSSYYERKMFSIGLVQQQSALKVGGTPLVEVCENGQLEMAKTLIESGADINAGRHSEYDVTPLIASCYSKKTEIVKYLLSKSCDLRKKYLFVQKYVYKESWQEKYKYLEALHAACRAKNNEEIVDLLMEKRKDWNHEHLTEAYDCDKDMIAYVNSKRNKFKEKSSSSSD